MLSLSRRLVGRAVGRALSLTPSSTNIVPRSILEHLPRHRDTSEETWPRLPDLLGQDDRRLVILDDNLSGIATVYDTNILLDYSVSAIEELLTDGDEPFFIITNTRALEEKEASKVIRNVMDNLTQAVLNSRYGKAVQIVSRMDSTLRCHYPTVVNAVQSNIFVGCDSILLAPQVFEGGRVTFNDIHYIEDKATDDFIPVHMTSYAQDAPFAYNTSHLKEWVVEKALQSDPHHPMDPDRVVSITLHDIREGGALAVQSKLESAPMQSTIIVNALHQHDMDTFMMGLLLAESTGSAFIYSVGSSFVASRMGLQKRPPLSAAKLQQMTRADRGIGGLLVVDRGARHVAEQIDHLVARADPARTCVVSIEAARVLWAAPRTLEALLAETVHTVDEALRNGQHVVLSVAPVGSPVEVLLDGEMDPAASGTDKGSLSDSTSLSHYVSTVIRILQNQPSFILTTGGGTAYDMAAHGCGINRGRVLGQIMDGVSVWRAGLDSALPDLHCVTFPDNIAGEGALTRVAEKLGVPVSADPWPVSTGRSIYDRIFTSALPGAVDSAPVLVGDAAPAMSLDGEPRYLKRVFEASTLKAPLLVGFDVESLDMARAVVSAAARLGVSDVMLRFIASESGTPAAAEAQRAFLALASGMQDQAALSSSLGRPDGTPTIFSSLHLVDGGAADVGSPVVGLDSVVFDIGLSGVAEVSPGIIAEGRVNLSAPFDSLPGGMATADLAPLLAAPDVLEVRLLNMRVNEKPSDKEVDALCTRLMELSAAAPHRPLALKVPSVAVGMALSKMLPERPRAPVISRIQFPAQLLASAGLEHIQRVIFSPGARPPHNYGSLTGATYDAMRYKALEALAIAVNK